MAGCPEKLMGPLRRAGITKVLIPQENVEDLEDVAEEVKEKLEIIPIRKRAGSPGAGSSERRGFRRIKRIQKERTPGPV